MNIQTRLHIRQQAIEELVEKLHRDYVRKYRRHRAKQWAKVLGLSALAASPVIWFLVWLFWRAI